MPLSTFAGGRLVGVRHGSNPPWVLALHGWRRDHRDFDDVLRGLDAIALDLPGFGSAVPPPVGWDTSGYAEWIAPVLEEMAPATVLLGHSFGGRVALRLGNLAPDQVGSMVLAGVPLVRPPGTAPRKVPRAVRLGRTLHRLHLVGDRRMEVIRHRYGSADYRAASGVLRQVLIKSVSEDGTYGEALAQFPGPIDLVWGEADSAAPVAGARVAVEYCQRGQLQVLAGVDHFTPQRAAGELRAALLLHRPA